MVFGSNFALPRLDLALVEVSREMVGAGPDERVDREEVGFADCIFADGVLDCVGGRDKG